MSELDAFRELVVLEPKLSEWPRAVPLLERALTLYEVTHLQGKREDVLKRLAAEDSMNGEVWERIAAAEGKRAKIMVALRDEERNELECARGIVQETGRVSVSVAQRRMGVGYSLAIRLVEQMRM